MKKTTVYISDGQSIGIFFLAVPLWIAALYFFFNSTFFTGVILTLIGLLLITFTKGTAIDFKNRRMKKYIRFLVFKPGDWISIEPYSKLILLFSKESQMGMAPYTMSYAKTYDIYFSNSDGSMKLEFQEFTDYKMARECLEEYAALLHLKLFDEAEEVRSSIASRETR